jgi:hypothetical protein
MLIPLSQTWNPLTCLHTGWMEGNDQQNENGIIYDRDRLQQMSGITDNGNGCCPSIEAANSGNSDISHAPLLW